MTTSSSPSTGNSSDAPLTLPDPDTAHQMREVLKRAGFHSAVVQERLGLQEKDQSSWRPEGKALSNALYRTRGSTPLDTLLRLFLLGSKLDAHLVQDALAPQGQACSLEDWLATGLLELAGQKVQTCMQLSPVQDPFTTDRPGYGNGARNEREQDVARYEAAARAAKGGGGHQGALFIVSDALWRTKCNPKHVMGNSGSSQALLNMTIRRPMEKALDLGTGCGIQALRLASHCQRVIATDFNPRAVNLAAFNARLNGVENVEARFGDLYAPVADESFDLIVANPPFVISPEKQFLFRDSGLPGDEISRKTIREGAQLLKEGGYAEIMCEWAHRRGEDWRERLRSWVADTGCDCWVLQITSEDPRSHAETWVGNSYGQNPEAFEQGMDRWLNYYDREQIESISYGFLALHRRSPSPKAPNWFLCEGTPLLLGECGESIVQGFAHRTFLLRATDEEILSQRFQVSRELRWEQQMAPTEGGWEIRDAQIRLRLGLGYLGTPNPYLMAMLTGCRGQKTLAQLIQEVETTTEEQLDREGCLRVVREMIAQGFLLPEALPQI